MSTCSRGSAPVPHRDEILARLEARLQALLHRASLLDLPPRVRRRAAAFIAHL